MELDICDRGCWCLYCKSLIIKGEKYLDIRKEAQRRIARVNICSRCLKALAKQIAKKDIQAMENRLALKELEKNNEEVIKCSDCLGYCNLGEYPHCKLKAIK